MKKFLSLSAIALAVSMSLTPSVYANQGEHPKMCMQKAMSQLDLTPDQKTAIESIKTTRKQAMMAQRKQMHEVRMQIAAEFKAGTMDENKINTFVNQEKEIIGNIIKDRLTSRLAFSKVLTDTQKAKLQTLKQEFDKNHPNSQSDND